MVGRRGSGPCLATAHVQSCETLCPNSRANALDLAYLSRSWVYRRHNSGWFSVMVVLIRLGVTNRAGVVSCPRRRYRRSAAYPPSVRSLKRMVRLCSLKKSRVVLRA